jgi:cation-transporting ATPase E
MMPINELTIGAPAFLIALLPNYSRPASQMLSYILEHTLPAALTVVINTVYLQVAGILFDIPWEDYSTMIVFLVGVMGFYHLSQLVKPLTFRMKLVFICLIAGFVLSFILFGDLLTLNSLFTRNVFFYMPLVYFSYHVHGFLGKTCRSALDAYHILKKAGWTKKNREADA